MGFPLRSVRRVGAVYDGLGPGTEVPPLSGVTDRAAEVADLSDLELLSTALQEVLEAQRAGLVLGPGLDEVALRRAERRARRQDAARLLRMVPTGGAA